MKKFLKLLSLLVFSLTLCVIAVKVCFWIGEKFFFDRLFYQKSAVHGYSKKASLLPTTHDSPLLVARTADLRALFSSDPQVLGVSSSQIFRVAIIGDSVAYGTGVKTDQRFSAILENELSKRVPTEVYNFSLPGDSLIDHYTKYQKIKALYGNTIDVYIFTIVNNDLYFDMKGKYENQADYDLFQQECLGNEFTSDRDWRTSTAEELMIEVFFPTFQGSGNICYLQTFLQKIDPQDAILFVNFVWGASREEPNTQGPFSSQEEEYNQKGAYAGYIINKEINAAGYTVLNPPLDHPTVSKKENHPSQQSHRAIAGSLLETVRPLLQAR